MEEDDDDDDDDDDVARMLWRRRSYKWQSCILQQTSIHLVAGLAACQNRKKLLETVAL